MLREVIVTDDEISATTDVFLKERQAEPIDFANRHSLEVAGGVEAPRPATGIMAEGRCKQPAALRTMAAAR